MTHLAPVAQASLPAPVVPLAANPAPAIVAVAEALQPDLAQGLQIDALHLTDYAVRVVNPSAESAAKVRATAEFEAKAPDGSLRRFSTIGVDENVVDASWQALSDAIQYHLIETHAEAPG